MKAKMKAKMEAKMELSKRECCFHFVKFRGHEQNCNCILEFQEQQTFYSIRSKNLDISRRICYFNNNSLHCITSGFGRMLNQQYKLSRR